MNLLLITVKNLLFFLVFAALIEQLFDGTTYKKYAGLFLSCMCLLMLMEPLRSWTGFLDEIAKYIKELFANR